MGIGEPMGLYVTRIMGVSGPVDVEVQYRVRPWGVDLDEVYIADTSTILPLTTNEYRLLAKEITAHLMDQRDLL